MNASQIFSQADQESALQKRLYRFYIRRLENLTEPKIHEQLKEIKKFLIQEDIFSSEDITEAVAELLKNEWSIIKITAYFKVLSWQYRV